MIKCEHCGTEPVQPCADCRWPGAVLEETLSDDYCPACRNLRPANCPGCSTGGGDVTPLRIVAEGKAYKTSSPYILGCIACAMDQAFLSNPLPRDTLQREQWFNGWLDTNDRFRGASALVDVQCPCEYVTVTDLRIIQLLRL